METLLDYQSQFDKALSAFMTHVQHHAVSERNTIRYKISSVKRFMQSHMRYF